MTGHQFLAAALALACATAATAQAPEWHKLDAATGRIADVAGLEQLERAFPDSASVHVRLLNAYLGADAKDRALAEALLLTSRGYSFSAAARAALLGLYDGDARQKLERAFAAGPAPLEASETRATVPAEAQLVEGAAFDPKTGRLFVSTIVSRALFVGRGEGPWSRVAIPGAGSLAGMALDRRHRRLWIASGSYDETPEPQTAARGLIGLDLDSGKTVRKAAPDDATLGDIALAGDGTLYASDPVSGAIYSAPAGQRELSPIVPPGTFRSPQGIVPWRNGGLLVSDYAYGLAFVDAGRKVWRVASDVPLLLDGIDGLWRHGDTLVAVQNGAKPPRIVELAISPDGLRVTGMRVLERAHSAWTEPVGGGVVGDDLLYIATSQWDSYGKGGKLREGAVARPTELRLLPLGTGRAPAP